MILKPFICGLIDWPTVPIPFMLTLYVKMTFCTQERVSEKSASGPSCNAHSERIVFLTTEI